MQTKKQEMNVLLYGLGPIGIQILQNCLDAKNIRIIGAVDIDPQKIGQDVGVLAGKEPVGVKVVSSVEEVDTSAYSGRKLALHATGSNFEQIEPQITQLLQHGYSVVSTCEQMSFPWNRYPQVAEKIDQLAKEKQQAVIGTGINPGFVMDSLTLFATSVSQSITGIYVSRKVDVTKRRIPLQKKVGIGMSAQEFQDLARQDRIGHVGLEESLRLIAYGLQLNLKDVHNSIEPTIAAEEKVLAIGPLKKGEVSGLHQVSRAVTEEGIPIELDLVMSVDIEQEDRIRISTKEADDLEVVVPGGIFGDTATANVIINTAKTIHLGSNVGLLTMADIPLVRNVN